MYIYLWDCRQNSHINQSFEGNMRMLSVVIKPYERVAHKVSELHRLHHKFAVIMSCHDYPLTSSTPPDSACYLLVVCYSDGKQPSPNRKDWRCRGKGMDGGVWKGNQKLANRKGENGINVILKRPDHVKKLSLFFLPDTFLQPHVRSHYCSKAIPTNKEDQNPKPNFRNHWFTTPLVQAQHQQTQSGFFCQ